MNEAAVRKLADDAEKVMTTFATLSRLHGELVSMTWNDGGPIIRTNDPREHENRQAWETQRNSVRGPILTRYQTVLAEIKAQVQPLYRVAQRNEVGNIGLMKLQAFVGALNNFPWLNGQFPLIDFHIKEELSQFHDRLLNWADDLATPNAPSAGRPTITRIAAVREHRGILTSPQITRAVKAFFNGQGGIEAESNARGSRLFVDSVDKFVSAEKLKAENHAKGYQAGLREEPPEDDATIEQALNTAKEQKRKNR